MVVRSANLERAPSEQRGAGGWTWTWSVEGLPRRSSFVGDGPCSPKHRSFFSVTQVARLE
eukprot:6169825-Prymnesium_polylepis.1